MEAPFRCKGCGRPRYGITQYCPDCESTGPHIEAATAQKNKKYWAKATAAKQRIIEQNNDNEFHFGKQRKDKVRTLKEPVRNKDHFSIEQWSERNRETEKPRKAVKSTGFNLPGRSWLFGTLFVAVALLIVLLVMNNGFSGTNTATNNPDTVSANQNNTSQPANNNDAPPATASSVASSGSSTGKPSSNSVTKPAPSTPQAPDTAMPKLTGSQPEVITGDTSVTIAWKTDEESNAVVKYGTTVSCDFDSPDQSAFKTDHNVFISSLTPNTLYYYEITVADKAGNSGLLVSDSFRTESISNSAPYVGSKAPNFTLRTLDGTQVSLSQFQGKKVILNFWASWCTPCKVELPHLQEIWEKYRDSSDVTVLTVAGSESVESEIVSYVDSNDFTFPVCLDNTESTFNRYDLTSIPKTFFIDKSGTIKKVKLGMFTSPGEIDFMLTSY